MKTLLLLLLAATVLQVAACTERYDEVYDDGFVAGRAAAFNEVRVLRETTSARAVHAVDGDRDMSTEVCGAGGIILNGVHVSFGTSGCVRVYGDGSFAHH